MKALELADSVEKNWSTGYREQIVSALRRFAAVEADCAPYLKDGETPAERIKRALADTDSLMSLYRDVVAERDALKAELEAEREESKRWLVKTQNERDARKELEVENERLLAANLDCIAHYEDARAELERIKALPPVAVRYDFDGYGWHYIDSGSGSDWLTRHKEGEELYTLRSKT